MVERAIVAAIIRYLRAQSAYVIKVHGGPFGTRGEADIHACMSGRFIAIEVKRPGQKPTPLQLARLAQIAAAGGLAFVATSVADVAQMLSISIPTDASTKPLATQSRLSRHRPAAR